MIYIHMAEYDLITATISTQIYWWTVNNAQSSHCSAPQH